MTGLYEQMEASYRKAQRDQDRMRDLLAAIDDLLSDTSRRVSKGTRDKLAAAAVELREDMHNAMAAFD